MIFNLFDSSQIVIDGAQSWYGEVVVVGPGICGGCAAFVGMGFGGAVLTADATNSSLSLIGDGTVCFQGGFAGTTLTLDEMRGLYT